MKNKKLTPNLQIAFGSMLLIAVSWSEPVDFEKTSRIVNSIQLDETRIMLAHASELLSEGSGGDKGGEDYFYVATLDHSFILDGDKLLVNGRMITGFKAGGHYTFKNGLLYTGDGKVLPASADYLHADRGEVVSIDEGNRKIRVVGVGVGGGITEKFTDDYLIWASSYICARIWDGDFYLWGVNYGRIKEIVEVNLNDKTVTIDKGKPVPISQK